MTSVTAHSPPFHAVRLLEFNRPARHPWLTPEVVEQELARQDYEEDRIAQFMDSLRSDDTMAVDQVGGHLEDVVHNGAKG